jgi:hypothetical protein
MLLVQAESVGLEAGAPLCMLSFTSIEIGALRFFFSRFGSLTELTCDLLMKSPNYEIDLDLSYGVCWLSLVRSTADVSIY